MKHQIAIYPFIISTCINFGCSHRPSKNEQTKASTPSEIVVKEIDDVLVKFDVIGAVLIYEPKTQSYYSNNFEWTKMGYSPASTFKIPNSIIAIETGIVTSEVSILKWGGEPRRMEKWERDLTLKDAFQMSCVPCYQDIARKIGTERMKNYLQKLNYPGMVFDSTSIDNFWLEGDSKITQFEQIDFLERFYYSKLPVSENTVKIMKEVMVIEKTDAFILSGKSGWTFIDEMNVGWLVGYLESRGQVYFFATNIQKTEATMNTFPQIRMDVTMEAFRVLGILKPKNDN